MKTIVSEISEGIYLYEDLYNWVVSCSLNPSDDDFVALDFLGDDPDKLKCNGTEIFFMHIEINDSRYVLTSDELNSEQEKMLMEFFDENFRDNFSDEDGSTWEEYNKTDNVIAYRGGSGYFYTIWKYEKI